MKGKYIKPMVTMESFSLVGGLLRDCNDMGIKDDLTSGDPMNCVWDLGGGMNVFLLGAACNMDGEDMGYGCYNNVSEGSYVFRS